MGCGFIVCDFAALHLQKSVAAGKVDHAVGGTVCDPVLCDLCALGGHEELTVPDNNGKRGLQAQRAAGGRQRRAVDRKGIPRGDVTGGGLIAGKVAGNGHVDLRQRAGAGLVVILSAYSTNCAVDLAGGCGGCSVFFIKHGVRQPAAQYAEEPARHAYQRAVASRIAPRITIARAAGGDLAIERAHIEFAVAGNVNAAAVAMRFAAVGAAVIHIYGAAGDFGIACHLRPAAGRNGDPAAAIRVVIFDHTALFQNDIPACGGKHGAADPRIFILAAVARKDDIGKREQRAVRYLHHHARITGGSCRVSVRIHIALYDGVPRAGGAVCKFAQLPILVCAHGHLAADDDIAEDPCFEGFFGAIEGLERRCGRSAVVRYAVPIRLVAGNVAVCIAQGVQPVFAVQIDVEGVKNDDIVRVFRGGFT